jgi:flagellar M-ring protein FliF
MDAMDFLRRSLSQIQTQLAGLTISQKLLIGLLLLIMVATAFFTVANSSKPTMVVLIDQPMSPQEINKAEMHLAGKHSYKVEGDKILVPADEAFAIRGELFAAQALPSDTTMAFTELVKANTMFTTDRNSERQWNVATQVTLSRMLKYFPYIESGTVIVVPGQRSGIGRDAASPTASVTVKVKNNEALSTRQVDAIVAMVAGSVSGLKREAVNIIDGQRSYRVQSADAALPSDLLEYKKAIETDLTQKLLVMFGEIPNVKIAVNAIPDLRQRSQQSEKYDPKGIAKAEVQETRRTSSSNESTAPRAEPGVKPNVGVVADSGSSANHSTSTTTSDTTAQTAVRFDKTTENITFQPGAELKELTASISLPRSYFVSIFRRMTKDPKADPEDEKLKPIIDEQLKFASLRAVKTIGAPSEDSVRVDWFDDTLAPATPEIAVAGSGFGGNAAGFVSQYAKQFVLALFAIGVLGMMLMMVKKSVPAGAGADIDPSVFFGNAGAGAAAAGRKRGTTGNMDTGDDVFGEANQGDAVLTGIELDDDTLASRKMVDEVSTMIKDNPENAAALIKRWIAKGK